MSVEKGNWGEAKAKAYLKEEKGHEIIAQNWRYSKWEIDLISKDQNELVFTEVKLRKTNDFGSPEEFVNRKKQQFLIQAANAYVDQNDIDLECRFDIISILFNEQKGVKIHHIEDAFRPYGNL